MGVATAGGRVVVVANYSPPGIQLNSKLSIDQTRDGIFKLLKSPGIDSKESALTAYVAWRAETTILFLFDS